MATTNTNQSPSMADWIRQNWQGEWNASGIDRAQELATLLQQNGITAPGQLAWGNVAERDPFTNQPYRKGEDGNYYMDVLGAASGPENAVYESVRVDPRRQLMIGDRGVGFLGNIGVGGNFEGRQDQYTQDSNRIGWSAQGGGNVGYHVYTDAQGNPIGIRPNWASSSDAGTVRDVLKGAAVVGGAALGMNAAFGGLGGAGAGAGAGAAPGAAGGAAAAGAPSVGLIDAAALSVPQTASLSTAALPASSLGAAGAGAAGAAGGLSGAWNGTNFGGAAGSSIGGGMSTMGDWIQLGGLVNSVFNRPDTPDTSGINDAARTNAGIATRQQDLAERQYADSKAILDQYLPMLRQQFETSLAEQTKSIERADDAWADYTSTWRPVEQRLAQTSLEYANPQRYEQEAARAASDATTQVDRAMQEQRRSLEMAGASPEKIAALESASRLAGAKTVAGAQSGARREAESKAIAYLDNAARFGRNMPSTGLAAASLAGAQGQQAQGGFGTIQNAVAQPAITTSNLYDRAAGTSAQAGSLFGNAAGMSYQGSLNDFNSIMGAFAGAARYANGRP